MLNHSIFCIFHCNRYIFKVVGRNLEILLFRGLVRAAGEAVLPFLGHDFIGSVPAALCWIAVVPKLFLHGVNKSKFYSGWWPIQDWPKFLGTLGKLWWWHSILYSNQPDVFENTNKHSRKGTVKLVRGLETEPGAWRRDNWEAIFDHHLQILAGLPYGGWCRAEGQTRTEGFCLLLLPQFITGGRWICFNLLKLFCQM